MAIDLVSLEPAALDLADSVPNKPNAQTEANKKCFLCIAGGGNKRTRTKTPNATYLSQSRSLSLFAGKKTDKALCIFVYHGADKGKAGGIAANLYLLWAEKRAKMSRPLKGADIATVRNSPFNESGQKACAG